MNKLASDWMFRLSLLGLSVENKFAAVAQAARFRLSGWALVSVLLTLAVVVVAPHQLPVAVFKLYLVAVAGVMGYYLDRSLFPYARPGAWVEKAGALPTEDGKAPDARDAAAPLGYAIKPLTQPTDSTDSSHNLSTMAAACMLRRAVIVSAAMISVGLGA